MESVIRYSEYWTYLLITKTFRLHRHMLGYSVYRKIDDIVYQMKYAMTKAYYNIEYFHKKINIDDIDKQQYDNILYDAIDNHDVNKVNQMIKKYSMKNCSLTNVTNRFGENIMHALCYNENMKRIICMEILFKNIHDLFNKTNKQNLYTNTPFMMCYKYDRNRLCKTIIDNTDHISDNDRNLILFDLFSNATSNILIMFIKKFNNNIHNTRDQHGNTVLSLACSRRDIELVNVVLMYDKVNINTCNNLNVSPLHISSHMGDIEIVKLLLKNGCYIE